MNQRHFLSPIRAIVGLVGASLVGGSARGQEAGSRTPAEPLTLQAVVAEGLERNPELRFYRAEIDGAKSGRRTAGLLPNPELGVTFGQKAVHGSGLDAEGVAWSVTVMQPFEWPGRLGLRKAIANRDIELAELGLERFRAALAARIRSLAFGLFAAQQKATAAREVADRFKALREVLVQRDPAGLTPLLETRVIEATELNFQRKASDAALATETARLELNQLRGAPADAALRVHEPTLIFRPAEEKAVLLALARTNNFEIRVRLIELAQQGFRVDLARNERFPSLAVGPFLSEERADDRERILGVSVSMPLPFWNRNRGNIDAAGARQAQAETLLFLTQRDTERQVIEAALIYEAKVREMARWRPDSAQHFQEAAETADRHYRLGAVPVTTYVELQKQYLEAVESLLDTRREALEAASHLEHLTGLPQPLARTGPPESAP